VDSTGQTIDFLLTAKRDRGLSQALLPQGIPHFGQRSAARHQRGQEPAYPVAVEQLKQDGTVRRRCRVRQCKYLNNMIEQDHRTVKRRVWLAMGYGSFRSAWRTLRGIEAVSMIRKGRARWVAKTDARGQARFIHRLFGIAA
jgi:transposase-like protein